MEIVANMKPGTRWSTLNRLLFFLHFLLSVHIECWLARLWGHARGVLASKAVRHAHRVLAS